MPYVERMYITQIEEEFQGDAYFPTINEKIWKETEREKGTKDEKNPFNYEYITYIKE